MKNAKTDIKNIISKALSAASLVDYQTGSIVSKTLIDKKAGTITLFAFSKGQGLSEHTAPYDAFLYALEGSSDVTISGKKHKVKGGDIIIMPANEPHSLKIPNKFKMMLVMIRSV